MAGKSTPAQDMARARAEFVEAQARNVTILELRRLKARERTEELMRQRRADQRWAERRSSAPTISDDRWMMRD